MTDTFHRSLDAALDRLTHQEADVPTDRNGAEVFAEDVLDREEYGEYRRHHGPLAPRRGHDPAPADDPPDPCPACHGMGIVPVFEGDVPVDERCAACGGDGERGEW